MADADLALPTPGEWACHQAFHQLTVNERDYERKVNDRLRAENEHLRRVIQRMKDLAERHGVAFADVASPAPPNDD